MEPAPIVISVVVSVALLAIGWILKILWSAIQQNTKDIESNRERIIGNKEKVGDDDRDIYKEITDVKISLSDVNTQLRYISGFITRSLDKEEKQDNKIEDIQKDKGKTN